MHTPQFGRRGGRRRARPLHAHIGWLFVHDQRGSRGATRPICSATPSSASSTARSCCGPSAGLVLPFLLGLAIGGSLAGGLTALLWGGRVRLFLLHHVT